MLRKIECYLTPSKLEGLRDLVLSKGIEGMSVLDARGFGARSEVVDGVPLFEHRVKVEIVLHEDKVDDVLMGLKRLATAGELGAGKAFVIPVEDVVRLSTREHGRSALL
jgi:nitrogen regulatory protein P-II 1